MPLIPIINPINRIIFFHLDSINNPSMSHIGLIIYPLHIHRIPF